MTTTPNNPGQHRSPVQDRKLTFLVHQRHGTSSVTDPVAAWAETEGAREVVVMRFPFLFSPDGATLVELRAGGECRHKRHGPRFYRPTLLSYLKDFCLALVLGVRQARHSDVIIATTNLLALAALVLRGCGVTARVVYWMIDFTPRRWPAGWLNGLYRALDRLVCYRADRVWSLNEEMFTGRVAHYGLRRDRVPQRVVPHGNTADQYTAADHAHHDPHTLCYLGGLLRSKGTGLFVPILQALVKRGHHAIRLVCIGDGDRDELRAAARAAGVADRLVLHGGIADHAAVEQILLRGGVAIAPYQPEENSFSYFADPGKIKVYLGCGLPVVLTAVPPIARLLTARGAGLVARYQAEDFADQIEQVIDPARYPDFQRQAVDLGREFQWPRICDEAMRDLFPNPPPG